MKQQLLLVLLAGLTVPGFGQGRDTAFAVHKLFLKKRAAGKGLLATGASIDSKAQYAQRPDGRPTAQEARQDILASAAFTGVGVGVVSRYSAENEAAVLRRYAAGWGLPPDIRRKLRRKYFHRTAQDLSAN